MKKDLQRYLKMTQEAMKLEAQERKHIKAMEELRLAIYKKADKLASYPDKHGENVSGLYGGITYAVEYEPEMGNTDWKQQEKELTKFVKNFDKDLQAAIAKDVKHAAKRKAEALAEKKRLAKEKAQQKEHAKRMAAEEKQRQADLPQHGHPDEEAATGTEG